MDVYTEERPWGKFDQYTHNEVSTVKILTLLPGSLLSYQRHQHREEFWEVIDGEGYAILNDERVELEKGSQLFIKKQDKHRVGSEKGMRILEVSFGMFDEEDNERLADEYGRAN